MSRVDASEIVFGGRLRRAVNDSRAPANHLRHSKFVGLREDKNARDVIRESVVAGESLEHGS